MKYAFCILAFTAFLCGCSTTKFEADNNARLKLTRQMDPAWLKANIEIGKTTEPQVQKFFGEPLYKNLWTGSSDNTNSIPVEMWTYQGGWDKKVCQPKKFIAFSFTNNIASAYKVIQNPY